MRSRVPIAFVSIALVASCFFPSFDKFEPSSVDGGSSTDAGFGQRILCGDRSCVVGFQFCCLDLIQGVVGCIGKDNASECTAATNAYCDGNEDCNDGEVCCGGDQSFSKVVCKSDCPAPGRVVCTGNGTCPEDQACSVELGLGHKACQ